AGCRVVGVEANFYDGLMHPVDSKDIAFQVAGYWAFKEAFMKARPLFARTDQFGRGAHSRRLHGQSRGRSFQPSRENSWRGCRRTISNRPRRRSRDGTLPLRKCPALAYRRTRRSLRAIQSLRRNAAGDRAARDRRSEKSASRQQQPGALSFTRSRARFGLAAAILPSKTWGRSVNLGN